MSEAAGLTGKHTNHSVRRTMISTLRKENVEPLDIIALAGQINMKSLDSYSSTSTEQQKSISLKLSNYIQTREAPNESLADGSQVLSPRVIPQQNKTGDKNVFSGVVFNNFQFTFTAADAASTADHAAVPKKKFKGILPIIDSDDDTHTFCHSDLSELDFTMSLRYILYLKHPEKHWGVFESLYSNYKALFEHDAKLENLACHALSLFPF